MIIYDVKTLERYEISVGRMGENYLTCPVCSGSRKKKRDKCFCWNADKNVGRCHHCEAIFAAESRLKSKEAKQYFIPEWRNKTGLTDKAARWFEGRMISQDTLRKARVYSDTEFMPQLNAKTEVICFPYFVEGKLRNIKYRGPRKSFKMVKDAELVFYNFDTLKAGHSDIIICEGEIDALTFIECGYDNVVSVPNGAGATDLAYLDNYIGTLEHIERFYIAADFDEPGLKLRNELIRRLGYERCRIVLYNGRKDINELFCEEFKAGVDEAINKAVEMPIEGYLNIEERYDDIYAMYINGLPEGAKTGIAEMDEYIRWQTSRLAIWTGMPSHGKSEMVDMITVRLNLMHGWKTLFFSPENYPLEFHFSKIAEKITGRKFKRTEMDEQLFGQVFEHVSCNYFWLEPYENATLESIIRRAMVFVKRKGIKQLVIDPFNCLEHKRDRSETASEYIGRFLDELARFAKQHDVLVHLVAHPTKMEKLDGKYAPPTLYDISGSANFYNKADYGISVYRDFMNAKTYLIPLKIRFKNLGRSNLNGVELRYNNINGRFESPSAGESDIRNESWLKGTEPAGEHQIKYDYDETTPF